LGSKVEDLSYDAAGSLVGRALGNGADSARYYIGDDLTVVVGSTGSSRTVGYAHVRLGSKRIASIWAKRTSSASTNGVIYYHRDSRSSVVATTTAGGNTGVSYRYLPSGAVDTVVGTEADETASELGFIGGIKLSGGLVHLRARVYSPLFRRFLQPDTIDLRRYTYAQGDPVNLVDPSGRVSTASLPQAIDPDISSAGAAAEATLQDIEFGISIAIRPEATAATQPAASAAGSDPYSAASASGTGLSGVDGGSGRAAGLRSSHSTSIGSASGISGSSSGSSTDRAGLGGSVTTGAAAGDILAGTLGYIVDASSTRILSLFERRPVLA
jgi:RHS repeat-associated protein